MEVQGVDGDGLGGGEWISPRNVHGRNSLKV